MRHFIILALCLIFLSIWPVNINAASPEYQGGPNIVLPAPDKLGGIPLMQALNQRHSSREMSNEPLDQQEWSNLLWAAWGVNRENGKRTAPTARNQQQVAVYVALDSGVWFYDGPQNRLVQVMAEDIRSRLGGVPQAIIYTALQAESNSPMHVGSIYQNAALYCASAGLANVPKVNGARALDQVLPLPEGYTVYIIQPVGRMP